MALTQLPKILIQELRDQVKMACLRSWEALHLNKLHSKSLVPTKLKMMEITKTHQWAQNIVILSILDIIQVVRRIRRPGNLARQLRRNRMDPVRTVVQTHQPQITIITAQVCMQRRGNRIVTKIVNRRADMSKMNTIRHISNVIMTANKIMFLVPALEKLLGWWKAIRVAYTKNKRLQRPNLQLLPRQCKLILVHTPSILTSKQSNSSQGIIQLEEEIKSIVQHMEWSAAPIIKEKNKNKRVIMM